MKSRDFAFWLQGFFEITDASSNRAPDGLTEGQVAAIKSHLSLVFRHDPDIAAKPHPALPNALTQGGGYSVPGEATTLMIC